VKPVRRLVDATIKEPHRFFVKEMLSDFDVALFDFLNRWHRTTVHFLSTTVKGCGYVRRGAPAVTHYDKQTLNLN
jgi:hypothetical protein